MVPTSALQCARLLETCGRDLGIAYEVMLGPVLGLLGLSGRPEVHPFAALGRQGPDLGGFQWLPDPAELASL